MPQVNANGINLEYDIFGDPAATPLLTVMGLGAQMTGWDPGFCEMLADRGGFRIIRFDNRDVGLSGGFENSPAPDLAAIRGGDFATAPYRLADMADDAAALLTALGIDTAHVVGASMGGMIVQEMAIRHPQRLLSICSIMSTTGDRTVGAATPEASAALMTPAPASREEALDRAVTVARVIGSSGFPFDEARIRAKAGEAFDRAVRPDGFPRQFAAIMSSGDRTEALRKVDLPFLVIHGAADPLVGPSGGEATAKAVPGARLLMIECMGHDLPPGAWSTITDAIVENATRSPMG